MSCKIVSEIKLMTKSSGVCLSTNGTLLPCRRHFAQTPAVLDLIITDVNGTDSVQWRKWDSFLNQANYIMATNQSFYDSSSKAAAAFMLLSFFFNVATIAFTITTRFSYPSFSLLLDIIDLVFVIISSVLWTLMFVLATLDQEANDNITLSISQPFKMGPAYIVLWAICLAKILVVPSAAVWILKCCGRAAKNMAKESYRIADDVTAETADGLFSATTGFMVREVIG